MRDLIRDPEAAHAHDVAVAARQPEHEAQRVAAELWKGAEELCETETRRVVVIAHQRQLAIVDRAAIVASVDHEPRDLNAKDAERAAKNAEFFCDPLRLFFASFAFKSLPLIV